METTDHDPVGCNRLDRQQVHASVLGRTADASGLAHWQDQSGRGPPVADAVRLIVTGQEFQGGLDATLQRDDWLKLA